MSRKTRKLMWSVPLIAAVAVIGALAAFMTLVPNPAAADGAPGAVTGLNASDVGRHHVVLSWTAATGTVTGHRIDISSDGFVWMSRMADTGSDDTMYKVEGLDAGTRYYFRVYALNGDHTGPLSIRPLNISVMTTPAVAPDVVTGLTATRGLSKKITLAWQQPAYNGGADVARYCILARGVQSGATFGAVANCTATADATGLADIASAIQALSSDPQTAIATSIVVLAKDVEADDGSATWTIDKSNNATPDVDTDDQELGDGITAMFQVVAVNTAGNSIASNIAEGNTAAAAAPDPATAPAAPTNLKVVGANGGGNDNTVSFYWNRPAGLPDDATVQVQRQVFASGTGWSPISTTGGWVNVEHDATGDATNGLVTGGTNANHSQFLDDTGASIDVATGKVRYRVRYVANQLTSGWVGSQVLDFPFPQVTAHSYDGDGDDVVGNVSALPVIAEDNSATTDVTEGLRPVNNMGHFHRIDLAWDRNNYCRVGDGTDCTTTGQPSTYAVDVIDGATAPDGTTGATDDWDFLADTISASRTTYRHNSSNRDDATKLVSDETRHYRVFPWHAGRYGYPVVVTANTKLATVPGRIPTGGLRVTANGDDKLDLNWSVASNDGGSPVTGYIIQVSQDRDNNDDRLLTAAWCDVAHQEVSDPPVAADRMYTYDGDIRSTGVSGCADATDPPAAPLTADGEALASGYGRWFRVIPLNKKSTTDLTADASTAWVLDADSQNAIPAFGRTGAATPPAAGAMPSAPIGLVAETALNVHSELTTDKGVLLTWDEPASAGTLSGGGDAAITDYVIQVSVDGGAWTTLDDGMGATATDWTHSDPLPAATEQRVYQVAAKNSVGQGPWSNMAYYSTTSMVDPDHTHAPVALTKPQNVMASSQATGSLDLEWDAVPGAERYILIAVDMSGATDAATGLRLYQTAAEPGTSTMGNVTGLVSGRNYLGIVVAVKGTGDAQETEYGFDSTQVTVQ